VRAVPGTLETGGASFASTRWSVVAACDADGTPASADAEAAVAQLCRDYWPPLYSFVRRRGFSPADAQDLVQGFFTHFLQDKIYAQTDSALGKFRSFLLASLKNYIVDVWHRENTLKRGGGREFVFLDAEIGAVEKLYQSETVVILEEERHYEQRWATALVTRALERLRVDFSSESKAKIFEELKPFVCGGTGLRRQEEVAELLAMPIDTLRSHLSRMRARYRALLREEVARTIGIADDVDEELRHLSQILIAECRDG
jgi:RNA polymerase sigma factor (sigma-70 family)